MSSTVVAIRDRLVEIIIIITLGTQMYTFISYGCLLPQKFIMNLLMME